MIEWVPILVSAGVTLLVALMSACAYRMNRNRQSCRMVPHGWCQYSCFCEQEEETHRDDDMSQMQERHAHELSLLRAQHENKVMELNRRIEQLQLRIRLLRDHVRRKR